MCCIKDCKDILDSAVFHKRTQCGEITLKTLEGTSLKIGQILRRPIFVHELRRESQK